ncbi:MAG TPA: ferrochelatase [Spirillospora sp.]|nr:ferrochelatase [Spirillospora sp.]
MIDVDYKSPQDAPRNLMDNEPREYDALLIVSFGGPEGMDDVIPFLENVLRGRNIPRARLEEVGEHYRLFNGVSPINAQNRALIAALKAELTASGPDLPIYWGNRNWHPYLTDTLRQMTHDGVRRALAFFTTAYSSYSSCRQYREDIQRAQAEIGPDAPAVDKIRAFYNHPGFIEPNIENLRRALEQIPPERRARAHIAFTAHSLPLSMARNCAYEAQLHETCRLVAEEIGHNRWQLVYQSRSGPPHQPWLEPDIVDHLKQIARAGVTDVVVMPIGFISDHMEVLYDLDTEAAQAAQALDLNMIRAATVGTHPTFIRMIRELILERMTPGQERRVLGMRGPSHDVCGAGCCLPGQPGKPAV